MLTDRYFRAMFGAAPASHGHLVARLAAFPARLFLRVRDYLRIRRDLRHLEELPDYLLEDVGLTREDLRKVARRTR